MRVFPSFLLILALPFIGKNAESRVNRRFEETITARLRTPFLDPSAQSKDAYRICYSRFDVAEAYSPALRVAGAIRAFVASKPSPSDFWEEADKAEKTLKDYVPRLLESAATYFKSNAFTGITDAMNHIVNDTAAFRESIQNTLNAHHITLNALSQDIGTAFMGIADDLKKFPSSGQAPGHATREQMVDKVLNDTTEALKKVCASYGIEEEAVSAYFTAMKPHLQSLIVSVGDINEQHPELLPMLAFSIAALLIPESWILRPFLSLFGFGPMGPVKGSAAALLQSRFWGATVESGSWFSFLQAAGTGTMPRWAALAAKLPLLVAGLTAPLVSRCTCRQTARIS